MTISEIARRDDHDRKTIRAYLSGHRAPGVRQRARPDVFDGFADYVQARLTEDPHLWAVTLFDELVPLGFTASYPMLTRQIRARGLRRFCESCAHVTQRPNAVIEHPPGEETQFDWVEMPDPPAHWGFGRKTAYVLVGSLAHSGVWRGVIDIVAVSGAVIARHRVAQSGLGVTVCDTGHVTALEAIALASAPPGRPHRRKERIPPGTAARRAAAVLTGTAEPTSTVISLAAYEQAAKNRNTLR